MSLGYLVSCPKCGGGLVVHVGPGQNAPWLCEGCRRGWWQAELTSEARRRFRPEHADFGRDGTVAAAVAAERAEALERKHSVHPSLAALPGVAERLDGFLARGRR